MQSERVEFMTRRVLDLLNKRGDQQVSEITRMLKNDAKETRETIISGLLLSGYVTLHNPEDWSKRGTRPTYARLTDEGRRFIKESNAVVCAGKAWRVA